MSTRQKGCRYTTISTTWSSTDEARQNYGRVPTRPGHRSFDMSQIYRVGHTVAGHRRGNSNTCTFASDEVRAIHDWAPTRRKSSLSSTYPVGHTNMAIVHVTRYRRNKATRTNIHIKYHTGIWMSNPTHDDDHQRSLIGGIPWDRSRGYN